MLRDVEAAGALADEALQLAAEYGFESFRLAATDLFRLVKSTRPRLVELADRFGPSDECADVRAARTLLEATAL